MVEGEADVELIHVKTRVFRAIERSASNEIPLYELANDIEAIASQRRTEPAVAQIGLVTLVTGHKNGKRFISDNQQSEESRDLKVDIEVGYRRKGGVDRWLSIRFHLEDSSPDGDKPRSSISAITPILERECRFDEQEFKLDPDSCGMVLL